MPALPMTPAPNATPAPNMTPQNMSVPPVLPGAASTQPNMSTPSQSMTPAPQISSVPPAPSAPSAPPIATSSPLTAVYDRDTANPERNVVRTAASDIKLPPAPATPPEPGLLAEYTRLQAQGLVPPMSWNPGEDVNSALKMAIFNAKNLSSDKISEAKGGSQRDASGQTYATSTTKGVSHPFTTKQRPSPDGNGYKDYYVSTITGEEVDQTGMPLRASSSGSSSGGTSGGSSSQSGGTSQSSMQGTSQAEKVLENFLRNQAAVGDISAGEQASIEQAGRSAGAAYDPLIASAKEEKKQGMAKGLIAGGQAGGFLNSQIAGIGAFVPTAGGTFIGAGGSLERLQDSYSAAISNLESKKIAAIQDAMAFQTKAIRTGKTEDLDRMKTAFDMAVAIDREKRAVAQEGLDRLVKLQQLRKYESDDAVETFKQISEAGIDMDDSPEYFQELDAKRGVPQGTFAALWEVQQDVRKSKSIEDAMERQSKMYDNAKKVIDIADKFGTNVPIYIDGNQYMYQGQDLSGLKSGTQTDSNGRTTYWQVNPKSGTVQTQDLGFIGSQSGWETRINQQGEVWRVNPQTNEASPMYPTQGQITWGALYPTGSQSPYRSPNDPYQGECAALNNDLYAPEVGRILGNSGEEKAKALSKYAVDPTQVRVGDTFLMEAGTTDHVGIVEGVETGPDGKKRIIAFESNMVPPGGGQISHGRPMALDDSRLLMIARVPLDPRKMPPVGPDSPATTMLSGGRPTSNAPLSGFGPRQDAPKPVDFGDKLAFQKFVRDDPWVSQMPDIHRSYMLMNDAYDKAVKAGATGSKAPADQALVTLYNKMLDPTSVVREGEYARTFEGQSYLSRASGFLEKAKQGGAGLTDQERAEMVNIAKTFFDRTYSEYNDQMDFYEQQGQDAGINTDTYLNRVKVETPAPNLSPNLPPPPQGQVTVWDKYTGQYGYAPVADANKSRYQRL